MTVINKMIYACRFPTNPKSLHRYIEKSRIIETEDQTPFNWSKKERHLQADKPQHKKQMTI